MVGDRVVRHDVALAQGVPGNDTNQRKCQRQWRSDWGDGSRTPVTITLSPAKTRAARGTRTLPAHRRHDEDGERSPVAAHARDLGGEHGERAAVGGDVGWPESARASNARPRAPT